LEWVNDILLAFAGGIIGAALGATWSGIICGILVTIGCLCVLAGGSPLLLTKVALGPMFGFHCGGFLAGLVAACYAASVKKNIPIKELGAKDILSPLLGCGGDVLLVGGVAAVCGYTLGLAFEKIPVINWFNTSALAITIISFISRAIFLKEPPWGSMESIKKYGYLGTDNYRISWLPWMAPPSRSLVYGFGWGVFSAGLAMVAKESIEPLVAKGVVHPLMGHVVPLCLGFGITLAILVPLAVGRGPIQHIGVQHHVALNAALAYMYWPSLWVGGIVGIGSALLCELMARMFWNHGSSHVDPPTATIAVGFFIINALYKVIY